MAEGGGMTHYDEPPGQPEGEPVGSHR